MRLIRNFFRFIVFFVFFFSFFYYTWSTYLEIDSLTHIQTLSRSHFFTTKKIDQVHGQSLRIVKKLNPRANKKKKTFDERSNFFTHRRQNILRQQKIYKSREQFSIIFQFYLRLSSEPDVKNSADTHKSLIILTIMIN